jgi:hypothetical protein
VSLENVVPNEVVAPILISVAGADNTRSWQIIRCESPSQREAIFLSKLRLPPFLVSLN